MLMTQTKYENKVQEYCAKVGITNQFGLRRALMNYGVSEATARDIWIKGAHPYNQHRVIEALEKLLGVDAKKFLEEV